jgi:hypothetical protein
LRLAIGCWALFGGLLLLGVPAAELDTNMMARWWGVLIGGAGLAITLREAAFMLAVFLRAKEE